MTHNVDRQADRVLARFQSQAQIVDNSSLSRRQVEHMAKTGWIHPRHWPALLRCAAKVGADLTPFDFIAHLVEVRSELAE